MHKLDELRGRVDLLLALDALLHTASVTRAAERAHLSQPAMSRALGRLRLAFGDPLLVRAGAVTRLTPRAVALREPVADILRRTAKLLAPAHFDPISARQRFRCIIPDVLAAVLLPPLLNIFRAEAPDCHLVLEPWPGRADTPPDAIVTSELAHFPELRRTPLYQDRDVLAVGRSGRLPEAPLARPHVAVVPPGFAQDPVDSWLSTLGQSRCIDAIVPSYLLALRLVAVTDLLAILPSRLIANLGESMQVRSTELPFEQQLDQVWLLHPPHLEEDGGNIWLRDALARGASLIS